MPQFTLGIAVAGWLMFLPVSVWAEDEKRTLGQRTAVKPALHRWPSIRSGNRGPRAGAAWQAVRARTS